MTRTRGASSRLDGVFLAAAAACCGLVYALTPAHPVTAGLLAVLTAACCGLWLTKDVA